ncbi:MAG: S-adenosylmethionine:tRNA ribosyltransferase-isomerase, partial [Acidimicrobiaceae bacterium]
MTSTGMVMAARLTFDLPSELEAREPPEARGLTRDAVRMMVASRSSERLVHSTFTLLPAHL